MVRMVEGAGSEERSRSGVVWLVNLGVEPYAPVLALQHRLMSAKRAGWSQDVLLLLEHEPVYTLGLGAKETNLRAGDEFLQRHGIEVVRVDRGGDITYHGPGQIVGYPILDLHHFRLDVGWYVRALADAVIRTLAEYGLEGLYDREYPGVWLGNRKICAFGCRNKRWIMYHGLALNLDPNMEHWGGIIPCGLVGREITTLHEALGWLPPTAEVRARLAHHFAAIFQCELVEVSRAVLEEALAAAEAAAAPSKTIGPTVAPLTSNHEQSLSTRGEADAVGYDWSGKDGPQHGAAPAATRLRGSRVRPSVRGNR